MEASSVVSRGVVLNYKQIRDLPVLEMGFLIALFFLPLSLSVSEGVLYGFCLPVWIIQVLRRRDFVFVRSPYFWPVVAFVVLAIIVSLFGLRPAFSLRKCHRLLLTSVIFITGSVAASGRGWSWRWLAWSGVLFVAGSSIRGVLDLGTTLRLAILGDPWWYWSGDITRSPFYMVALCFLLACIVHRPNGRLGWLIVMAILLNAGALIISFKRGTWIAFGLAMLWMSLLTRRLKMFSSVLLAGIVLCLIPAVRTRIAETIDEFRVEKGGRFVLWTQVAPGLIRDHPYGVGYYGTRPEDFLQYSPNVDPNLESLHNNPLQILAELGWIGLGIWLCWMGICWREMYFSYRLTARQNPDLAWLALGAYCAFVGLFLNGMVDNNFVTSKILITYFYIMGLSDVLRRAGIQPSRD